MKVLTAKEWMIKHEIESILRDAGFKGNYDTMMSTYNLYKVFVLGEDLFEKQTIKTNRQ